MYEFWNIWGCSFVLNVGAAGIESLMVIAVLKIYNLSNNLKGSKLKYKWVKK